MDLRTSWLQGRSCQKILVRVEGRVRACVFFHVFLNSFSFLFDAVFGRFNRTFW